MFIWAKMKQIRVSLPITIVLVVLAAYLPFLYTAYSLRGEQLNGAHYKADELSALPTLPKDSRGYVAISENLLNNLRFSGRLNPPYLPDTFRTPIFPLSLATFKAILGSYKYFPIFQIFLVIFTAIIIFKIGESIYSTKAGFLAAMLFIFDPTTIFHSMVLLSEIEYVFFLTLSIYLFLFFKPGSENNFLNFMRGFTLGFATLVRPISMYLLFLLLPFYFYRKYNETTARKTILGTAIILLGYLSITFPWMLRNKTVADSWQLSSARDYNFFSAYVPEYLSFRDKIDIGAANKILTDELGVLKKGDIVSLENSDAIRAVYLSHIKRDPFGYVGFHLFKTIPFFLSSSLKNFFASYNGILELEVFKTNSGNLTTLLLRGNFSQFINELKVSKLVFLEQLLWLVLYILGLITLFFKKNRQYSLLFWLIIVYFAVLTGPVAYARFRLPVTPLIFLLAAWGLYLFYENLTTRWRKIT